MPIWTARSSYKSDGSRIHFLPELIAGGPDLLLWPIPLPSPLYLSRVPSPRPLAVNGDDVKNDTVFVAPFSIKPGPASSSYVQHTHKGVKIIYVLWAHSRLTQSGFTLLMAQLNSQPCRFHHHPHLYSENCFRICNHVDCKNYTRKNHTR